MRNTILLVLLLCAFAVNGYASKIDLSGAWRVVLADRDGREYTVTLPGSLTSNGLGDDVSLETPWTGQIVDSAWFNEDRYLKYRTKGNIKIPAWLQPLKYYKGKAIYSREFEVTSSQKMTLTLERPHWHSEVVIDGKSYGSNNSLGTPHRYVIEPLEVGSHTITITIDNSMNGIDVGQNAHSVSDHTQSNWNGIVGEISLTPLNDIYVSGLRITPEPKGGQISVEVSVVSQSDTTSIITLWAESKFTPSIHRPRSLNHTATLKKGMNHITLNYDMGSDFYIWDEFNPYLYRLNVDVDGEASAESDFGMRDIYVKDKRIYIGDRAIFLRGTLECAIFPKTGYPPTDVESWQKIISICKSHGLNHLRFHSWCPPRAAFEAADRSGFYIQAEGGAWATVGDGTPLDRWVYKEADAIIEEYGNHPSFILYCYGNEPSGANQGKFLGELVDYLKSKDNRRLFTSAAGWPAIDENQYRNDMYPRLKVWGRDCLLNSEPPRYDYNFDDMVAKSPIPWVSHEIGQWCVYPDFREINMYDDAMLQAKNFEIFRETLDDNGMSDLALPFLMASGKLQSYLYKMEIEAALRTENFGGFQLLDLHDFPGQGTALVGVLNPFWQSKGYITAHEYHSFASATVPLIRVDRTIFQSDEQLVVDVEVASFGAAREENVVPSWQIKKANGEIFSYGNMEMQDIEIGDCFKVGTISHSLADITSAERLTIEVDVMGSVNSWNIWVYPKDNETSVGDVKIVSMLDSETISYLEKGGKVLLSPMSGSLKSEFGGDIQYGFTTIFWNSAWTSGAQPPLTLGLLIDDKDPSLEKFPTEFYTQNQWFRVAKEPSIVNLTAWQQEIDPIVRVIDDWFENRSLALMFEAKVGDGCLFYCGADIYGDYPEAKALKRSIVDFMNSSQFAPKSAVACKDILSLFR